MVYVTQTVPEASPEPGPTRRRSPLRATWFDMVRSLVVIVAIVVGLVLLVPRPHEVAQPAVDVTSAASAATRSLGFEVAVPRGLPATWKPTTAEVQTGADGVRAWAISYRTPAGYAGLRQARNATPKWESTVAVHGEPGATQTVGGLDWQHRDRADRGTTTLVHRADGMTVVTTSLGSRDDASVLAEAVAPALS
jgi:hypothetical protein